jgi:rhamnulokinase
VSRSHADVSSSGQFLAVDLGASSGRVVAGVVQDGQLALSERARFAHRQVRLNAKLYWDLLALWQGMLRGLRLAASSGPVASVGVDSWGVDYALLDDDGELLDLPAHRTDASPAGALAQLARLYDPGDLYRRDGTALDSTHTLVQLLAEPGPRLQRAGHLLMIADLFGFWMTGVMETEVTIASTTGLLAPGGPYWDMELAEQLGIPGRLLSPLRRPGELAGPLERTVADEAGLDGDVPVRVVAAHDTASAVAAVPSDSRSTFAFISIGTWSLVGIELEQPVVSDGARLAGFTNELGVEGRIRFLRKVTGLRLLTECLRSWESEGASAKLEALLVAADGLPAGNWVIDPDDESLRGPGDVPSRIGALCRRVGRPVPVRPVELVRCIVDSLALAHRRAVRGAVGLSTHDVSVVHIVGGGSQNALLCQATADACALEVIAGPVEASSTGNVLIQASAAGALPTDLQSLRWCVRKSVRLQRFRPINTTLWDRIDDRAGHFASVAPDQKLYHPDHRH